MAVSSADLLTKARSPDHGHAAGAGNTTNGDRTAPLITWPRQSILKPRRPRKFQFWPVRFWGEGPGTLARGSASSRRRDAQGILLNSSVACTPRCSSGQGMFASAMADCWLGRREISVLLGILNPLHCSFSCRPTSEVVRKNDWCVQGGNRA